MIDWKRCRQVRLEGDAEVVLIFKDYERLLDGFTVEKLKQVIRRCSERLFLQLRISGNKSALLARAKELLTKYRSEAAKYELIQRTILEVHRETYSSLQHRYPLPAVNASASGPPGVLPIPHPNKLMANGYPTYATQAAIRPPGTVFWDETPFYRIEKAVSGVVICPESGTASHRTTQFLTFQLSEEARSRIRPKDSGSVMPKYQIRLYMTQYSQSMASSIHKRALVEFPPTCEAIVNSIQVTANLKGIKKQPGTVTPPDITKYLHHEAGQLNRVEFRYINTLTKFILVANLVEQTGVDKIVETLISDRKVSREDVEKQLKKEADDSDIVATRSGLSLKCPLSHLRISTPARSAACSHVQCFDATSFYSLNEQTPAWSCPVCYKKIRHQDIIVDGFFQDMLTRVPNSYESVVLNEDFTWMTEDCKVRSDGTTLPVESESKDRVATPVAKSANEAYEKDGTNSKKRTNVFILDDDDDDGEYGARENFRPRKLSPSTIAQRDESLLRRSQPDYLNGFDLNQPGHVGSMPGALNLTPTPQMRTPEPAIETVDLTLSSDDEPDQPLASIMPRERGIRPYLAQRSDPTYRQVYNGLPPSSVFSNGSASRYGQTLAHAGPSTSRPSSIIMTRPPPPPLAQQHSPNGHRDRSSSLSRFTDQMWENAIATMSTSPVPALSRPMDGPSQTTSGSSPSTTMADLSRPHNTSYSPIFGRTSMPSLPNGTATSNGSTERAPSSSTQTPEANSSPQARHSPDQHRPVPDERPTDMRRTPHRTPPSTDRTEQTNAREETPTPYSDERPQVSGTDDRDLDPDAIYRQLFGPDADRSEMAQARRDVDMGDYAELAASGRAAHSLPYGYFAVNGTNSESTNQASHAGTNGISTTLSHALTQPAPVAQAPDSTSMGPLQAPKASHPSGPYRAPLDRHSRHSSTATADTQASYSDDPDDDDDDYPRSPRRRSTWAHYLA